MREIAAKKGNPPLFFQGGDGKQKADQLTRLIATNLSQEYAGKQRFCGFLVRGSSKKAQSNGFLTNDHHRTH